jgi:hypothetical protein
MMRILRAFSVLPVLFWVFAVGPGEAGEVWYGPNYLSADMLDLFENPGEWQNARARVDVFTFYLRSVVFSTIGEADVYPNDLASLTEVNAFAKLRDWGIAVAVEHPVLGAPQCSPAVGMNYTMSAFEGIRSAGGEIDSISIDESVYYGMVECGFSQATAIQRTAEYIRWAKSWYPHVKIGMIEPYPSRNVTAITESVLAFRAAGAALDFLHLDINMNIIHNITAFNNDLRALRSVTAGQGLPLGIIFHTNLPVTTDVDYAVEVLYFAGQLKTALGSDIPAMRFQSWQLGGQIPRNLPETRNGAFTNTILKALKIFEPPVPSIDPIFTPPPVTPILIPISAPLPVTPIR